MMGREMEKVKEEQRKSEEGKQEEIMINYTELSW